jgi:hypothetical protein
VEKSDTNFAFTFSLYRYTLGSLLCPNAAKAFRFAAHTQAPYASFVERPLLLRHVHPATGANVTGTSSVPYRHNKWHDPKDGWAVPLAVGGFYDVSWPASVDFNTLTLEATGLQPGEHAYVRFKHTTVGLCTFNQVDP